MNIVTYVLMLYSKLQQADHYYTKILFVCSNQDLQRADRSCQTKSKRRRRGEEEDRKRGREEEGEKVVPPRGTIRLEVGNWEYFRPMAGKRSINANRWSFP